MPRNLIATSLAALLLLSCDASAPVEEATAPPAAESAADVEAAIRALEQRQVAIALAGDRDALLQVFAEDFLIVNPSGGVANRDELLALLTGGTRPYSAATYTTDTLRIHGDVVVSTGTEEVEIASGAQAGQKQQRRITQVWVRSGGGWRLSQRHATLVAPPP